MCSTHVHVAACERARESARVCVCVSRKTVQVWRYLGRRLSLSHNLRPDGISRNACPCNRTVGTAASVRRVGRNRTGAAETRGGVKWDERVCGDRCRSTQGPCSYVRVAGMHRGVVQETAKGGRGREESGMKRGRQIRG